VLGSFEGIRVQTWHMVIKISLPQYYNFGKLVYLGYVSFVLGMCYILCTTSPSVSCVALGAQRGLRGGYKGVISPLCGGSGAVPLRKKNSSRNVSHFPHFLSHLDFRVYCWVVFWNMVFVNEFLFPIKELGLLTNPIHWVRVLDAAGSYMYIVL
jgi:hypothetical protein